MTDVENKAPILTTIPVTLDNNSFNNYVDDKSTTDLTISVKPDADITPDAGAANQISQWTILTIQSETIENLIVKFFKADGTTASGQADKTLKYGVTNNQTVLLTLNGDGKYTATLLSGNKFNNLGIDEIKSEILKEPTNIASKNYVTAEIAKIPGIDPNSVGVDEYGIPKNAIQKTVTINPSGWLGHSLGVIDHEVPADLPISIELKIELNDKFNDEFLAYPYKTGTLEEDLTKAPLAWSLFQQKTGLGAMPLAPGENTFKDYTNLTANKPDLPKVSNTTNDYLIGGRFNGANTIAAASVKDKMSVHSQGALLLHVVFSTITPRTLYFKIDNQYAPFVKILFYSFQIQSFYNGALKYFYAPLYKNVVFKESSFDEKGLFLNKAPLKGAAKKAPIENIYQFSKQDILGDAALRFSEDGNADIIDEEQDCYYIDGCGAQKNTGDVIKVEKGPKDCDFRYFADVTIFPAAGTLPLLKSLDRTFFTTPKPLNEQDNKNKTAFIRSSKEYNILPATGAPSTIEEKDTNGDSIKELFEVIDKDNLSITPVVDMSTDAAKGNIKKIAITVNSNMIFVIGKEFIKKITEGKFTAFDIIFNQKQYWLKFVFAKGITISTEDENKLKNFFPQFGVSTTISQKIISDGIDKIKEGVKDENMSMTFKPLIKAKKIIVNGQDRWILDTADRIAPLVPKALIMNADKITTKEFEVESLGKELVEKINKAIKTPLEVPAE